MYLADYQKNGTILIILKSIINENMQVVELEGVYYVTIATYKKGIPIILIGRCDFLIYIVK